MGILIHKPLLKGLINSTTRNLHRLLDVAHPFIDIFHTVVSLVFLAHLQALLDRQVLMCLEGITQILWLVFAH